MTAAKSSANIFFIVFYLVYCILCFYYNTHRVHGDLMHISAICFPSSKNKKCVA